MHYLTVVFKPIVIFSSSAFCTKLTKSIPLSELCSGINHIRNLAEVCILHSSVKCKKTAITRVPARFNGLTYRPSWKADSINGDIVKSQSTRPWMTSLQVNSKFEWRKWPLKSISTCIRGFLLMSSELFGAWKVAHIRLTIDIHVIYTFIFHHKWPFSYVLCELSSKLYTYGQQFSNISDKTVELW